MYPRQGEAEEEEEEGVREERGREGHGREGSALSNVAISTYFTMQLIQRGHPFEHCPILPRRSISKQQEHSNKEEVLAVLACVVRVREEDKKCVLEEEDDDEEEGEGEGEG
eukprot:CAMPEP_0201484952 /NCGR_PEP_ID=MMETSP0151_2-20130828/9103_1 /ASSEMBLY_ACC=CAM_ASM_000257 /TAXON_ID=200890 /ORGANISM="Paramoeba atlantica, Strain 621/1 / CCAP 1560/9" /LENGTH=110 /DNA_ID=CAMNT_0047868869 /DNA_START=1325 /DNA_END=1653 /DNA_ORIENTATION=+